MIHESESVGLLSTPVYSHAAYRVIEVHSISLQDKQNMQYGIYPTYPPVKSKQLQIVPHPRAPHLRPIIHEIAAHDRLLIVTIFALDTGGGAGSLQILFVNPETGATKWVDPRFAQVSFDDPRIRIDYLWCLNSHSPSCGSVYGATISFWLGR